MTNLERAEACCRVLDGRKCPAPGSERAAFICQHIEAAVAEALAAERAARTLPGQPVSEERLEEIGGRLVAASPPGGAWGAYAAEDRVYREYTVELSAGRLDRDQAEKDAIFIEHANDDLRAALLYIRYLKGPILDALVMGELDQYKAGWNAMADLATLMIQQWDEGTANSDVALRSEDFDALYGHHKSPSQAILSRKVPL